MRSSRPLGRWHARSQQSSRQTDQPRGHNRRPTRGRSQPAERIARFQGEADVLVWLSDPNIPVLESICTLVLAQPTSRLLPSTLCEGRSLSMEAAHRQANRPSVRGWSIERRHPPRTQSRQPQTRRRKRGQCWACYHWLSTRSLFSAISVIRPPTSLSAIRGRTILGTAGYMAHEQAARSCVQLLRKSVLLGSYCSLTSAGCACSVRADSGITAWAARPSRNREATTRQGIRSCWSLKTDWMR